MTIFSKSFCWRWEIYGWEPKQVSNCSPFFQTLPNKFAWTRRMLFWQPGGNFFSKSKNYCCKSKLSANFSLALDKFFDFNFDRQNAFLTNFSKIFQLDSEDNWIFIKFGIIFSPKCFCGLLEGCFARLLETFLPKIGKISLQIQNKIQIVLCFWKKNVSQKIILDTKKAVWTT